MQPRFAKTAIAAALFGLTCQYTQAQLEEVIVTAQKRSQSMQDVPVAVSAFGGNDIESLGWSSPADVASQVPNVQLSVPFGDVQPQFTIRGVSMIDWAPGQSSPVGVYIDEAYIGSPWLHGLSMYDMERIEVLRGPQGTLYGKNTTGGAINLITRTPQIDDAFNGYAKVGTGNYGLLEGQGAIEGTLVDGTLAGRFAVNYKDRDGFYKNNYPGGEDLAATSYYGLRGTLNWAITDNLSAILKASYADSEATASVSRIYGTQADGTNLLADPETRNPKYLEGSVNHAEDAENDMTMLNLKLDWDLGAHSIVSVTSWYDGSFANPQDIDGSKNPWTHVDWNGDSSSFSQDLRLVSAYDGPFNFIAGVYYGEEDVDTLLVHSEFAGIPPVESQVLTPASPPEDNPAQLNQIPLVVLGGASGDTMGELWRWQDLEKKSWAIYTDMTLDLGEKWSLNLGLRYTDDETTRDFQNISRVGGVDPLAIPPSLSGAPAWIPLDDRTEGTYVGGNGGNTTGIDAPFVPPGTLGPDGKPIPVTWTHGELTRSSDEKLSEDEGEVTGTIAINYLPSEDVMTYLRYSRGYRSGAFNGGLVYASEGDAAYADPEYVDAWEIGLKSEFYQGMMRLNAAAFYYDYKDQQFSNQVGISTVLENAGGVDILGMEVELLAMPAEGLTIQAGLGLIDAEYTELFLTGADNLKGNEPVSTPDTNFNLALDYDFDVGEKLVSRLHVDGNYVSEQWFSAYNDELVPGLGDFSDLQQDEYWLWNASISLGDVSDSYVFRLWVNNLADEEYHVFGVALQTLGFNSFSMAAPRTYGLDFTYRF